MKKICLILFITLFFAVGCSKKILSNKNNSITIIDGVDGITVGDEIALGTEHFYVISSDSEKTTLLAKYNLLIGYDCDGSTMKACKMIDTLTEGYGLQNETALGFLPDTNKRKGVIQFSSSNYWYDNDNHKLKDEYGSQIPAYVLDSNSNLYNYLLEYEKTLTNNGYSINKIRLLTYREAYDFKETNSDKLHNTSFWLGDSADWYELFACNTEKFIKHSGYNAMVYGIRPVIEIPTSDIELKSK